MDAGVYEGMPYDDYQAIDAMSSTRMGWLLNESPYYFKDKVDSGYTFETSATKLGSAAHCATLEPKRFEIEYQMEPDPFSFSKADGSAYATPRASKPYKEAVSHIESFGKIVLKQDDYMLACKIAKRIRQHPLVGPLLESAKGTETTLIWERDGLLCKARPDCWGVSPKGGWQMDLKSTNDFGNFSPWVVTKYAMHRQLSWYREGAIECGMHPEVNYLVAVSNDVPEVALFPLELDALSGGKTLNDKGWDTYRECLDRGTWPGRYDENKTHPADITDREKDRIAEMEVPSS